MLSRDLQRVLKIRDYCLSIQDTMSRFGVSLEAFCRTAIISNPSRSVSCKLES